MIYMDDMKRVADALERIESKMKWWIILYLLFWSVMSAGLHIVISVWLKSHGL